jgi:hypothetical protein
MFPKFIIAICITVLAASTSVAMSDVEPIACEPHAKSQTVERSKVFNNAADELYRIASESTIGGRQKP